MADHGFALVGLGAISGTHADAIVRADGAELRVVCDIDEERAKSIAGERKCDWATDLRDVLRRDDVDVVDITTWSGTHAPIGIECARAGKHVITTKPLDVRLEAIDALIEACEENGTKLAAIHQNRSLDSYRRVKKAIDEGRLGKLLMGNAYCKWLRTQNYYDSAAWRGTRELDGGGCLMNQGIHYIDALLWYMGDVETVAGNAATLLRDIEVEDCATAALRFKSGALGTIQGATCIYKGTPSRIEIHGERGNVAIAGDDLVLWDVEGEKEIRLEDPGVDGSSDPAAGYVHAVDAHVAQIEDFLTAIDDGREPALNGPEARRAVETILAVYRSSALREVVSLPLTGDTASCSAAVG